MFKEKNKYINIIIKRISKTKIIELKKFKNKFYD